MEWLKSKTGFEHSGAQLLFGRITIQPRQRYPYPRRNSTDFKPWRRRVTLPDIEIQIVKQIFTSIYKVLPEYRVQIVLSANQLDCTEDSKHLCDGKFKSLDLKGLIHTFGRKVL